MFLQLYSIDSMADVIVFWKSCARVLEWNVLWSHQCLWASIFVTLMKNTITRICKFVNDNPLMQLFINCTSMNIQFCGSAHQQNPWELVFNKCCWNHPQYIKSIPFVYFYVTMRSNKSFVDFILHDL